MTKIAILGIVAIVAIIGLIVLEKLPLDLHKSSKFTSKQYKINENNLVGEAATSKTALDSSISQSKSEETIVEEYLPPTLTYQIENTAAYDSVRKNSDSALSLYSKAKQQTGSAREATIQQLKDVLAERRKSIEALLETDTVAAYASLFPQSIILQLPAEVLAEVEQPVTLQGNIEVLHFDDFQNHKSTFQYFLKNKELKFRFYPVGEPGVISGAIVKINGYQIGDKVIAPVSKNTFQVLSTANPQAVGNQTTLVLLVNFLDSLKPPFTQKEAIDLVFNNQMQAFYKEASYNKIYWIGDVIGWYTVQRNGIVNGYCQWPSMGDDFNDPDGLLNFTINSGLDLRNYERLVLLVDNPCMIGGYGSVGKYSAQINGTIHNYSSAWVGGIQYFSGSWNNNHPFNFTQLDFILSHELGHNLGVWHANSWECGVGKKLYGNCTHIEYGNYYDVMGIGAYSLHFNAYFKDRFGWSLPSSYFNISRDGIYTLAPLESSNGKRIAYVHPSFLNTPPYYLEYRQAIGFDAALGQKPQSANLQGLFINWISQPPDPYGTRLLDMSPIYNYSSYENYLDWSNVTLLGFKRFYDAGRGIIIGPVISADSLGATFRVNLVKPVCIRNYPSVQIWAGGTPTPGGSLFVSELITNYDSPTCTPSNFSVVATVPKGWGYISLNNNPYIIYLEPDGDFAWNNFEIIVPSNAQQGEYNVEINVTNLNSGKSTNQVITYNIQ